MPKRISELRMIRENEYFHRKNREAICRLADRYGYLTEEEEALKAEKRLQSEINIERTAEPEKGVAKAVRNRAFDWAKLLRI